MRAKGEREREGGGGGKRERKREREDGLDKFVNLISVIPVMRESRPVRQMRSVLAVSSYFASRRRSSRQTSKT